MKHAARKRIGRAAAALALAAAAAAPFVANAHTDEYLATLTPPNGGHLRVGGPYHVELLVRGAEVFVFLTDHGDEPVDVRGFSGRVVALSGRERHSIELAPAGDPPHVLKGKAIGGLPIKGLRAVVRIKPPDGETDIARYRIAP